MLYRPQRARLAQTTENKAGRADPQSNIRPRKCLHARIHALWIIFCRSQCLWLFGFDKTKLLSFGPDKIYQNLDNVLHQSPVGHTVSILVAELSNRARVDKILNYIYHIYITISWLKIPVCFIAARFQELLSELTLPKKLYLQTFLIVFPSFSRIVILFHIPKVFTVSGGNL